MREFLKRLGLLPVEPGHLRTVGRLIILAGLVGAVAGLGAVAFQFLSHLVMKYGLEWVAGYRPAVADRGMEPLPDTSSRSLAAFVPG